MESITFRCENADCKKTLRVKEELAGKRIKCPKCGHKMKVPDLVVPPQPPPPAPVKKTPQRPAAPKPLEPVLQAAGAPLAKPPVHFKATRQSYGLFCPKCGGLLLPPQQMELIGIVCHHCGVQIEFG